MLKQLKLRGLEHALHAVLVLREQLRLEGHQVSAVLGQARRHLVVIIAAWRRKLHLQDAGGDVPGEYNLGDALAVAERQEVVIPGSFERGPAIADSRSIGSHVAVTVVQLGEVIRDGMLDLFGYRNLPD